MKEQLNVRIGELPSRLERDMGDRLRPDVPRAFTESRRGDPAHWRCPDCGEPCRCTDPEIQAMPHAPCGMTKKRTFKQRAKEESSDG